MQAISSHDGRSPRDPPPAVGHVEDARIRTDRFLSSFPTATCAAVAYNTALLLWKVGERRRACEHWLCFQRWPLRMEPSDYERRCAEVLPKPADRGADSHVSGELSKGARAALDRMVLSHWAKLRHQEAFEQHWNANPNGATNGATAHG